MTLLVVPTRTTPDPDPDPPVTIPTTPDPDPPVTIPTTPTIIPTAASAGPSYGGPRPDHRGSAARPHRRPAGRVPGRATALPRHPAAARRHRNSCDHPAVHRGRPHRHRVPAPDPHPREDRGAVRPHRRAAKVRVTIGTVTRTTALRLRGRTRPAEGRILPLSGYNSPLSGVGGETGCARPADAVPACHNGATMEIAYDDRGLVPFVIQDWSTGEVLTLAYANAEARRSAPARPASCTCGAARATSCGTRARRRGNTQTVRALRVDCDGDALLALVEPAGPACHTGERTCFFTGELEPPAPLRGAARRWSARSPRARPSGPTAPTPSSCSTTRR